jgi:hypothetical protein
MIASAVSLNILTVSPHSIPPLFLGEIIILHIMICVALMVRSSLRYPLYGYLFDTSSIFFFVYCRLRHHKKFAPLVLAAPVTADGPWQGMYNNLYCYLQAFHGRLEVEKDAILQAILPRAQYQNDDLGVSLAQEQTTDQSPASIC